ncbi:MAG: hypothetical protein ACRD11_16875 [Terriglobia bacterium]
MMVPRPKFILITSLFQTLELAAGFHRFPQRRFLDLPVEGGEKVPIGGIRVQNNLHRLKQRFYALLGALAEFTMAFLKGPIPTFVSPSAK